MEICSHCGDEIAPGEACMRIPSDLMLLRSNLYNRMAAYVANLDISSSELAGWVADTVYGYCENGGRICWWNGDAFVIAPDDIEDAFGEDVERWVRKFLERADKPLKQRPQKGLTRRLRFIWLAIQIAERE